MVVNKKYVIFGQKLTALRKKNQITQDVICEKLGCNKKTVYRWEKGLSYPLPVYHPILLEIIPEISQKWAVA